MKTLLSSRLLATAVLLGASCLTQAALAQTESAAEREYVVELLVFRHTSPATSGERFFVDEDPVDVTGANGESVGLVAGDAAAVDDDTAIDADNDTASGIDSLPVGRFEVLSADDYRLADAAASITRASRFSPLLHTGWRQTAGPMDEARAKSVAGRDSVSTVTGRVVLSRGRYLHLDVDLALSTADGTYPLHQSYRRIIAGKYYYIDHPYFGVVAVVRAAD